MSLFGGWLSTVELGAPLWELSLGAPCFAARTWTLFHPQIAALRRRSRCNSPRPCHCHAQRSRWGLAGAGGLLLSNWTGAPGRARGRFADRERGGPGCGEALGSFSARAPCGGCTSQARVAAMHPSIAWHTTRGLGHGSCSARALHCSPRPMVQVYVAALHHSRFSTLANTLRRPLPARATRQTAPHKTLGKLARYYAPCHPACTKLNARKMGQDPSKWVKWASQVY
jgi:hypothetical protein